MPRFSVIIPVYNVEPYLEACLGSLRTQGFQDWEAVCVDDGSTDGSGLWLDRFASEDERFRVIHQENQGVSSARNTGLKAAQGEYILFLDSDDMLTDSALDKIDAAAKGQDIICFGGQRYFEKQDMLEAADPLEEEDKITGWQYYCRHALEERRFAFVSVVIRCYRRAFLEEHHLTFPDSLRYEDNLFTPQACYYAQEVSTIDCPIYIYRMREGSFMTTKSIHNKQTLIKIANLLAAFFYTKKEIDRSTVYRVITHHYQVAFSDITCAEDRQLLPLVDWHLYRTVSRTRLRHRINYATLRLSPALFRRVNRLMTHNS